MLIENILFAMQLYKQKYRKGKRTEKRQYEHGLLEKLNS